MASTHDELGPIQIASNNDLWFLPVKTITPLETYEIMVREYDWLADETLAELNLSQEGGLGKARR